MQCAASLSASVENEARTIRESQALLARWMRRAGKREGDDGDGRIWFEVYQGRGDRGSYFVSAFRFVSFGVGDSRESKGLL